MATWISITLGRATLTDGWDSRDANIGASEDKYSDVLRGRLALAFPEHAVAVRLENSNADLTIDGLRFREHEASERDQTICDLVMSTWEDQDAWVIPAVGEAVA